MSGASDTVRLDHGDDLGDRIERTAVFARQVPAHARACVAEAIDQLAVLGALVAEPSPEKE